MEVPSILLNRLLSTTAKKGASSLHLSVGNVPVLRIDGKLLAMEEESIIAIDLLNKIIKSFLSDEEVTRLEQEKNLTLTKNFVGNFRFRVNIFYQRNTPSLTFDFISGVIRRLEDYGFPPRIINALSLSSGLLIVAGPDNAGKTSTAAAFIEEINRNHKKYIITLEDPIEYIFINKKSVVEQRQLGQDMVSYVDGLRHSMNEDVDVVYVGEIRENFHLAVPLILELASGNSLVILEINADNSIRALEKIINFTSSKKSKEATQYNLADVLLGVISQRLISSRGEGMSLAKEILVSNSPVKSLIREGKIYQLENTIQISKNEGMASLSKSIQELIDEGKISSEEAQKINI